jgi:hypothetical protein
MEYLICWLATFGLSFSAALTHGPFELFKTIREKSKRRFGEKHWIATGLQCPVCMSFWIGIPVTIALSGDVVMWLSSLGFTCAITSLSPD